jgi:hypothetical protein
MSIVAAIRCAAAFGTVLAACTIAPGIDAVASGDAAIADAAASDARPDASDGAGGDSGCNSPPEVTVITPSFGATVHVSLHDPSTDVFAFSAHAVFPCAPMQRVQFDYAGPQGTVQEHEQLFTSYADPFTQQTLVGGGSSSLAGDAGGQGTSAWLFSVTATDANNQVTVVSEPFTLVISNH